ncbi:adenosylhomocysteinase [Paracidovorax oryzae]|uniref:adenosylhomocysteinase n=1 Tax=Paracidovorax oryzae TaxID=862720 RepID=UPI00258ACD0E
MDSKAFFQAVLDSSIPRSAGRLVLVTHIVPGSENFVLGIHERLPLAAVIPKPSSLHGPTCRVIEEHVPVIHYTRDRIQQNAPGFIAHLRSLIGEEPFAAIDTGGYFSNILAALKKAFPSQLVGIVEDTENGHQKYDAALRSIRAGGGAMFPCPVMSVARSKLKEPEDFLVGQAITFSAEALLRELGNILTGRRALVLGYGKIGSSIARHLHAKGVRVDVYDTNPVRQVLALAHGYHTGPKHELLRSSELVFCATGNRSIGTSDLGAIRRNAYIFTATSADDEIENHQAMIACASPGGHRHVLQVNAQGNRFFLCNEGKSANFMHGGVVGPFIDLVQAELLFALSRIGDAPRDRVVELGDDAKRFISELWINRFSRQGAVH